MQTLTSYVYWPRQDYFVGKVREVVDQYQPDVLYFDAKVCSVETTHPCEIHTI